METSFSNQKKINVPRTLRDMGYHPIFDRRSEKESWVRNLGRGHYPRFHLYIKGTSNNVTLSLHMDQKKSAIEIKGVKRHAGEYDGLVVEEEMERIKRWIYYAYTKAR